MTGRPIETGSHAVVRRLSELENHSPSFTLYVDHRTSRYTAYQIGSRSRPFKTIQQALDAVQPAVDAYTSRVMWTIVIAGGTYDEDLVFDITNKRVRLQAAGPINLGIFDANTWQPSASPRRNITITGDVDTHYGNIRPYFGIAAATDHGTRSGAVSSSFTAFRISGMISIDATQTSEYSGTLEGDFEAEVYGSDGGDTGTSLVVTDVGCKVYINLIRSTFRGSVDLNVLGRITQAIDTEFRSSLTIKGFTRMIRCHFDDGLYTHSNDNNNTTSVKGILQSTFAGEFDGGDASPVLLLDRYTLQNFTLNSSTLGVGATTFLMDA